MNHAYNSAISSGVQSKAQIEYTKNWTQHVSHLFLNPLPIKVIMCSNLSFEISELYLIFLVYIHIQ